MGRSTVYYTVVLCILIIFFAGCTSFQNSGSPASTTSIQTETVQVTPEPTYSVTGPVLVKGEDVYSVKITTDSKETDSNTVYISVHYDSSSSVVSTGVGSELMATIFAYNYKDVPYDFNPQTPADVIDAGIPYTRIQKIVYPNNKIDVIAELPTDSVQGSLNLGLPYNYGVIVEKTGTRN